MKGNPDFPNRNLRQIGPGVPKLWSDKQTNRQTALLKLYFKYKGVQRYIIIVKRPLEDGF